MLTKIGQIAIPVADVDAATAFYRDTLGLPFLFDAPGMAFFRCGEVRLMLTEPESGDLEPSASIIYYRVDDIEAACERLRTRGVRFESEAHPVHRAEDHELWMAFFRDPDGNPLALMSQVAHGGA